MGAPISNKTPAYIAAALCLGSEEELPPYKFANDAAVAAFCERALRKRLEEQEQQEGKSADAADNSDPPVTAPPVHPAFMDRGDASKADREGLFHSFKEINDIHALGGFRFILAEWLVEQVENADATGFKMPAGQHVPPEALHRGEIDGETLIVSVSYCWASKGHGDPKLTTTKQICKVLKYLMASRHFKTPGAEGGIGNMKLLVFLDYMSLPQSSAGATFLDRQQFGLGLGGVNVLYAHSKTLTLLCTESHLNHVDGPDARTAYNKSG